MTVRDLINILYEFDPDSMVLVSKDEEGNRILPCIDVTEDIDHNCIIWP